MSRHAIRQPPLTAGSSAVNVSIGAGANVLVAADANPRGLILSTLSMSSSVGGPACAITIGAGAVLRVEAGNTSTLPQPVVVPPGVAIGASVGATAGLVNINLTYEVL